MTDIRTLTTEELRQRLDRGDRLHVWNVTTDQWFSGEMIPRSSRMPLDRIEQDATGVPKDAEIVAYCGGPQCPQSTQAARRLAELGYTNVRTYKDGVEGWKAAGHAIQRIESPIAAA